MPTYVTNSRSFTVYMKPAGKARPRITKRGSYTPQKTVNDSTAIRLKYSALHGNSEPLKGAVHMTIFAYDALPQSKPKSVESEPYTVKPDVDNIAKLVMDALNGLAYKDDAQITVLTVVKKERSRLINPRIDVTVSDYREAK